MAVFTAMIPNVSERISTGSRPIRAKLIDAPTAMKNSPSSNPLNGSRSLSSSCLYSLFARITPARKVPRAGLSPTRLIRAAMATTISRAEAVKSSRSRVRATTRNSGTMAKRPTSTTAATAPSTSSVCSQPDRSSSSVECSADAVTTGWKASNGSRARMGITDTSWNSSTAKEFLPEAASINPFSFKD